MLPDYPTAIFTIYTKGFTMRREEILDICSDLLDRITVAKGHLQLQSERKKVDYSLLILSDLDKVEDLVNCIVDLCKDTGSK